MKSFTSFLFVLMSATSLLAADSAADALRKGLFEEEANQNLNAAIKAYESAITQIDEQRKLAATAVFRLAECYRKLGKTNEAVTFYERVLRDYSDQASLLTLSQRQLASLRPAPAASKTDDQFSTTTLVDPAQVKLLEEEIKLVQSQIDVVEIRRRNGNASREELIPVQRELLALQRKLPANASQAAQVRLIEAEIKLVEEVLIAVQKRKEVGAAQQLEDVPLKRELLALQRELAAVKSGQTTAAATQAIPPAAPDPEEKEIRRLSAVLRDSPDLVNRIGQSGAGYTPLQAAARAGQLRVAEYLIANHAEVDRSNSHGTALHVAAQGGNKAMVELLLKAGANANALHPNGATPLHHAAFHGFRAVTEVLLKAGRSPNIAGKAGGSAEYNGVSLSIYAGTPLHCAVISGNRSIVELLLTHEADVSVKETSFGHTPLSLAVASSQPAMVELLLENKADIKQRTGFGWTVLHTAADRKNLKMVELLLSRGADVNSESESGETPLHLAVKQGSQEIVKALLRSKPALELHDRSRGGNTPLQEAVSQGHVPIVSLLLEAGADPNVVFEKSGQTPLFWRLDNPKFAEILLAHGAKVNVLDRSGRSPLDYLNELRRPVSPSQVSPQAIAETAELLRKAGANEFLPFLSTINIGRRQGDIRIRWFHPGDSSLNRFRLFELLGSFYSSHVVGQNQKAKPEFLPFPDLSKITIRKLGKPGDAAAEVSVDLEDALRTGDCTKDRWLEWGDLVEIPERNHLVGERWERVSQEIQQGLKKCLDRHVQIFAGRQGTRVALELDFSKSGVTIEPHQVPRNEVGEPVVPSFWLSTVACAAGVLRFSSDLTHVKLKRFDPITKDPRQAALNVSALHTEWDVWLRDGDVIEIPDKE